MFIVPNNLDDLFFFQDRHLLSKLLGTMNIFGLSFVLYVLKLSSGTGY